MRAGILLLAAAASVLALGAGSASAADFAPGSAGLGDPFFPLAGNGGYDVRDYDLTLAYEPAGNQVARAAPQHARARTRCSGTRRRATPGTRRTSSTGRSTPAAG